MWSLDSAGKGIKVSWHPGGCLSRVKESALSKFAPPRTSVGLMLRMPLRSVGNSWTD
jgi:hypothetical protein